MVANLSVFIDSGSLAFRRCSVARAREIEMSAARDRTDEERLVARARSGDGEAFAVLVQRHRDRVWRMLGSWVRDPSDREEVFQEVFLAAFRGVRRFRGDAKFSTWLLQIAVNQGRSYLRRKAVRPGSVEIDGAADADRTLAGASEAATSPSRAPAPDVAAERAQLKERVWALVERLPEDWQGAVRLRYQEEMTQPEIAATLGVPLGTVKVHLHRARRRLAEWIAEERLR
jgi:RNA polymerase sigma-70 factor (ECF subfamily)